MLDVALRDVSYAVPRSQFAIRDVTLSFPKSTHTAIVGPPAGGVSVLLGLIAGDLYPDSGAILIGTRDVTKIPRARRPLLAVTRDIDAPARWSVRHLLIAAVRQRSLDRVDRQRELDLAIEKWQLTALLGRALRSLSTTERTRAHVARIELLKPAILLADRALEDDSVADEFYRTLRVFGTTVISGPAAHRELGFTDRIVVLEGGRVVQDGTFSRVYRQPASLAAALATGDGNAIPIVVRGKTVESAIGSWELSEPPFQGEGIAVIRPHDFVIAERGAESDVIFGIEEAVFRGDHWLATGMLTGGVALRVALPPDTEVHKGRLLALCYDPTRFAIYRR